MTDQQREARTLTSGILLTVLRRIQRWLELNEAGETQVMTVADVARVIKGIADELEDELKDSRGLGR